MEKPQEMKVVTPSHSLPTEHCCHGATGNDGNGNNSGYTRNYEWNGSD